MSAEEWDWPPPRRWAKPTIEGRIERETVVIPRRRSAQTEIWPNRAADLFFRGVIGLYKIAFSIALTALVLACVWLIAALVKSA